MEYDYDVVLRELSMQGHYDLRKAKEYFTDEVKEYLKAGWQIHGGVSVTYAHGSLVIAQAIKRKK